MALAITALVVVLVVVESGVPGGAETHLVERSSLQPAMVAVMDIFFAFR
jgi:hypothetical protein